jgi:hypothetical protein
MALPDVGSYEAELNHLGDASLLALQQTISQHTLSLKDVRIHVAAIMNGKDNKKKPNRNVVYYMLNMLRMMLAHYFPSALDLHHLFHADTTAISVYDENSQSKDDKNKGLWFVTASSNPPMSEDLTSHQQAVDLLEQLFMQCSTFSQESTHVAVRLLDLSIHTFNPQNAPSLECYQVHDTVVHHMHTLIWHILNAKDNSSNRSNFFRFEPLVEEKKGLAAFHVLPQSSLTQSLLMWATAWRKILRQRASMSRKVNIVTRYPLALFFLAQQLVLLYNHHHQSKDYVAKELKHHPASATLGSNWSISADSWKQRQLLLQQHQQAQCASSSFSLKPTTVATITGKKRGRKAKSAYFAATAAAAAPFKMNLPSSDEDDDDDEDDDTDGTDDSISQIKKKKNQQNQQNQQKRSKQESQEQDQDQDMKLVDQGLLDENKMMNQINMVVFKGILDDIAQQQPLSFGDSSLCPKPWLLVYPPASTVIHLQRDPRTILQTPFECEPHATVRYGAWKHDVNHLATPLLSIDFLLLLLHPNHMILEGPFEGEEELHRLLQIKWLLTHVANKLHFYTANGLAPDMEVLCFNHQYFMLRTDPNHMSIHFAYKNGDLQDTIIDDWIKKSTDLGIHVDAKVPHHQVTNTIYLAEAMDDLIKLEDYLDKFHPLTSKYMAHVDFVRMNQEQVGRNIIRLIMFTVFWQLPCHADNMMMRNGQGLVSNAIIQPSCYGSDYIAAFKNPSTIEGLVRLFQHHYAWFKQELVTWHQIASQLNQEEDFSSSSLVLAPLDFVSSSSSSSSLVLAPLDFVSSSSSSSSSFSSVFTPLAHGDGDFSMFTDSQTFTDAQPCAHADFVA